MESDILTLSISTLNLIWLGLFIILIVIELFTVGLTTIWFAIGSLAAMAANTLGRESHHPDYRILRRVCRADDLHTPMGCPAISTVTG